MSASDIPLLQFKIQSLEKRNKQPKTKKKPNQNKLILNTTTLVFVNQESKLKVIRLPSHSSFCIFIKKTNKQTNKTKQNKTKQNKKKTSKLPGILSLLESIAFGVLHNIS